MHRGVIMKDEGDTYLIGFEKSQPEDTEYTECSFTKGLVVNTWLPLEKVA